MTILGSITTADRILAVADGRAERHSSDGTGVTIEVDKFTQSKDRPIMWGIVGDREWGTTFGPMLDDDSLEGDWNEFSNRVARMWSAVRQEKLIILRKAWDIPTGATWPSYLDIPDGVICVTGYVNGQPGVTTAHWTGSTTNQGPHTFFAGPYESTALAAWDVVRRRDANAILADPAALRDLIEPMCNRLEHIHLPVNIWEILTDGRCTKLGGGTAA